MRGTTTPFLTDEYISNLRAVISRVSGNGSIVLGMPVSFQGESLHGLEITVMQSG